MKLLIKQKVFSFRDCFSVLDEYGNERYFVKSALFSWGKKLFVTTAEGREVAYIEQQLFTFRPRYAVYAGGHLIGEVVKEFSFFRPHYTVEGANWDVQGDFWAHDYTVSRDGRVVVSIQKEWFTWGDCYALNIHNPADEIQALALVLAMDCAIEQQNNS